MKPARISWPAVLILTCLAATGCRKEPNGSIRASGHIEATEVRIAPKFPGRLVEAPLEEGDRVRKGDLVGRFDTEDTERELARARAEVEAADASLRLLLAGTRPEDLDAAVEQWEQAKTELAAAVRDLGRLEGLADRGTATIKARDDARTRRDVAARAEAAAKAHYQKLVAGPRKEEIEHARARKLAAEAAVAVIAERIDEAVIRAPRDGVITERTAEPYEVLSPGAPVAVLTDLARPWLNVYVGEPALSRIKLGDPVEVRVDGQARAFKGTVTFVSSVAEFTPKNVQTPEERAKLVFRIKVALDNTEGVFKPGMPADAVFAGNGTAPE